MPEPLELLAQFSLDLDSGDASAIKSTADTIKALPFETPEQIRAKHRLALHLYLVENKIIEGMEIFRDIVRAKIPCEETHLSQMSIAMGMWKVGLTSQATFELRKVISGETGPTAIKSMAYTFLIMYLKELKGHERELEIAQNENIEVLAKLAKNQGISEDLSYFKLLWVAALEERGQPEDIKKAIEVAQKIADDAALPKTTTSMAREAAKRLSPPRRK